MGGKASRDKGSRFEREIVNLLKANGLDAYRIPLSGASAGFKGDIQIRLGDKRLTLEAKSRGSGFKFIYDSLEGSDALCLRADRQEALIVFRLKDVVVLLSPSPSIVPQASEQ